MDEKPKKTLTDFIDENQKLLSTIGIFAALSVFTNQLPGDLAKSNEGLHVALRILSALLCILATMAFLEVLRNALTYPEQWFIRLFTEVLFLVFVIFVVVWVETFRAGVVVALIFFAGMTALVLTMTLSAISIEIIMTHTSILKSRSRQTRERLIPLFGSLIVTAAAIALVHHYWK